MLMVKPKQNKDVTQTQQSTATKFANSQHRLISPSDTSPKRRCFLEKELKRHRSHRVKKPVNVNHCPVPPERAL